MIGTVGLLHLEVVARQIERRLEVRRVLPHFILQLQESRPGLLEPGRPAALLLELLDGFHQTPHLAVVWVQLQASFRHEERIVETAEH